MEISERAAQLTPSLTLSIDSKAKAMKAEGIDVCGFGAGEPDFDTPEHIKAAAIEALQAGFTKYTPSAGIPELRAAIAEKLATDNGLTYRPGQVVVSNGAKHSCYNAILATCQPGDEVIIPSPYWVSYPDMVRLVGAEPVIVPTMERNNWKMRPEDFENAMTPRTKMLIMNSPCNPTGSVYTREELEAIVEVASGEDIYILSDEIYEKLVYDDAKHVSIASLSKEAYDLTITVNGFSKSYAMTGWRLGYLAAPEAVAKAVDSIQSHTTANPSSGCAGRVEGRSAGGRRHARGIRHASQLHDRSPLQNSKCDRGETAGRVLCFGECQSAWTDVAKFCRSIAQQSKRGRRTGRGLW
jgi:aspartate aminotransferase